VRARGFTLLEVLVAVFVFGIVAALAYGGYNQLIRQSEIVESSATRTRAIQSTVQRMAEDFEMREPRPIREPLGESLEAALRAGGTKTDTLLDQVRTVSFRFMDQNQSWHEQWPPLGYSGADAARLRPIAVEITLDLEDWGKIVRLVEVSG
jgi:general secretion pathway protein J